jgi:putative acetyltransferase
MKSSPSLAEPSTESARDEVLTNVTTIRPYQAGDEEALRAVFRSSVDDLAAPYYTAEQLSAWAPQSYDEREWAERIARLRPFVAIVEHRIAGYADLQPSGYIDHFFVAGAFARRGVGNALMRHIHAVADSRSTHCLAADVSLSAEKFFATHGFTVETRRIVVVRNVELPNARMIKHLFPGRRT